MANVRPGDALYLELHGETAAWTSNEHLLANLCDLTALLVWFQTEDGQKNRKRPKLTARPGYTPPQEGMSLGGSGVPVEEFADRWAAMVARQLEAESRVEESDEDS